MLLCPAGQSYLGYQSLQKKMSGAYIGLAIKREKVSNLREKTGNLVSIPGFVVPTLLVVKRVMIHSHQTMFPAFLVM